MLILLIAHIYNIDNKLKLHWYAISHTSNLENSKVG